jgi:hypothetical protein
MLDDKAPENQVRSAGSALYTVYSNGISSDVRLWNGFWIADDKKSTDMATFEASDKNDAEWIR